MIRIVKGREPKEWKVFRKTPNTGFAGIKELRETLLKEQGFICGYCMREIPVPKKPFPNSPSTKIEHLIKRVPQTAPNFMQITMGYDNFIICCDGIIDGNPNDPHCDSKKLKKDLDKRLFPTNPNIENIIKYSSSGEIKTNDNILNDEIKNILNLNHYLLLHNRKSVLDMIIRELGKTHWTKKQLNAKLIEWNTKGENGKHRPYCGIAISFLKKRIQNSV